jgi:hypothetical protein
VIALRAGAASSFFEKTVEKFGMSSSRHIFATEIRPTYEA